jgi:HEAT repeat protein
MVLVFSLVLMGPFMVPVSAEASSGKNIASIMQEIKNAQGPLERSKALERLSQQRPRSAEDVQAVLGALRDKIIDFNATEILWKSDDPQLMPFVPLFIQALDDPDLDVQGAAALTLGRIKAKEAVPGLIRKFESIPRIDEKSPASLRKEAEHYGRLGRFLATALGLIGDPRAVPALLERREFYYLEFGETPIAWIGAPALPALLKVAKDKNDPRREHVLFIISRIKDPVAVPALKDVLKDPASDPGLIRSVNAALNRMNASPAPGR